MAFQGGRSILTDPVGVGNWGPAWDDLGQASPWGEEERPALWIPCLGGQLSKARTQPRSVPLQATQRLCAGARHTGVSFHPESPPFSALLVLPHLPTAAPPPHCCPRPGTAWLPSGREGVEGRSVLARGRRGLGNTGQGLPLPTHPCCQLGGGLLRLSPHPLAVPGPCLPLLAPSPPAQGQVGAPCRTAWQVPGSPALRTLGTEALTQVSLGFHLQLGRPLAQSHSQLNEGHSPSPGLTVQHLGTPGAGH